MSKIIKLKGLYLKNFKGIKELDIDFGPGKAANIFGDNGTGKTSIFDAFTWLLFDKDSQDKSKFDVQPLDGSNNVVHMLDTEVTAVLEIDGVEKELKKVLQEKWVKPKGQLESQLKGVKTSYYIDGTPNKQGEYKKAIGEIIPEDIFKLLTNPMHFSTNLKWQDRKKVLMELIDEVTDTTVINYKEELKPLEKLLSNKNIDDLKKSIAAAKKKLIKDKENIPARVDELNMTLKKDLNFETLALKKEKLTTSIQNIEEQLLGSTKLDTELFDKKDKLYKLKSKLQDVEHKARYEADKPLTVLKDNLFKISSSKSEYDRKIENRRSHISYKKTEVARLKKEMESLRNQYAEIRDKELTFDENEFVCPTCHRPFEESDVEKKKEEMLNNFNSDKAEKLKKINENGCYKKDKVENLNSEIEKIEDEKTKLSEEVAKINTDITEMQNKIDNFKPTVDLESNSEYQDLKKQIEDLETELSKPRDENSQFQELKDRKISLQKELTQVDHDLNYKEINENATARITELEDKEKTLAQQIADLEKQEFLCEDFIRTKVELLESSINSQFKYVKFRFFKNQVNGCLDEDCEPLVNGVPFNTNLNSAARVNAGLDIINTLSKHYGISAPIFVDNKESVTQLIDIDSQIINLVVSAHDAKLRIESEEI